MLLADNVDPDQTPHYVASDPGLYYLPVTFLQVSPARMGKMSKKMTKEVLIDHKTVFNFELNFPSHLPQIHENKYSNTSATSIYIIDFYFKLEKLSCLNMQVICNPTTPRLGSNRD